jgi:UDP-N-acetylmuramate dehydrogenase
VRGRVTEGAPLAASTWFRVGGNAEILIRPADANDLVSLLNRLPESTPVTVIGAASNMIIRDGGIAGVTIRLARGFNNVITGQSNPCAIHGIHKID